MDEIKLKISNPATNMIYKKILLRKFFCMVFIDASGKKLDLYIATVFGGVKKDTQYVEEIYSSIQHDSQTPCSLQFEIFSYDNNEKKSFIEDVDFHDKTQQFWEQPSCIEKVWGKCTNYTDQAYVSKLLKEKYPNLYPNEREAIVDVSKSIYYITQDNKESHTCIVSQGGFEKTIDNNKSIYRYKLFNQNAGKVIDGLETMNWIHTEISLKSNVLNNPILFSIELERGKIYTPDFTWYFAPPAGNIVSGDSYVRIGEKVEKNAIQSVSDETTVIFKEWRDPPLAIEERKKSRVLFKSAQVTNFLNLSEDNILAVCLHIANPQGPTNRQFFVGLLVAFLLAFCSDKTRINDFYLCLLENCTCKDACVCKYICNAISILSPILLLCTFLTFILTPKKSFPPRALKGQIIFKVCRILSIVSTSFLMIYVFGLWLVFPDILHIYISCNKNIIILGISFLIAIFTNVVYLTYCLGFLKRKIYNYL